MYKDLKNKQCITIDYKIHIITMILQNEGTDCYSGAL